MTFELKTNRIQTTTGIRCRIEHDNAPISFRSTLELWTSDSDFQHFITDALACSSYETFRWETPALTSASQNEPFEFVLLDAPELGNRAPDIHSFQDFFDTENSRDGIAVFPNLGHDALLIVPRPIQNNGRASIVDHDSQNRSNVDRRVNLSFNSFRDLAEFLRNSPSALSANLWKTIGEQVLQLISEKPIWLNTAGGGVAWLHVRIDSRPKYYVYGPYKKIC